MARTPEELDDAVTVLEATVVSLRARIRSLDQVIVNLGASVDTLETKVKRVRRQVADPQKAAAVRTEKKLIRGKVVTRAKGG